MSGVIGTMDDGSASRDAQDMVLGDAFGSVMYEGDQYDLVNRITRGENMAILGQAGTGKSYVLMAAVRILSVQAEQEAKIVGGHPRLVCVGAPTGRAASNVCGTTINRLVGFVPKFDDEFGGLDGDGGFEDWKKKLAKNYMLHAQLKALQTLIIDEISMVPADFFDLLHEMLQHARGNPHQLFGGVQVVVFGDFRQLPPIARFAKDREMNGGEKQYTFLARMWGPMFGGGHTTLLRKNMRQLSDVVFAGMMKKIQYGKQLNGSERMMLMGRCLQEPPGPEVVRVFGTNKQVNEWNIKCMQSLETPLQTFPGKVYFCKTNGYGGEVVDVPCEFGGTLDGHGKMDSAKEVSELFGVDALLELKVGCRVMVTANISVEAGVCNGSMGYFRGVLNGGLVVDLDGRDGGEPHRHVIMMHRHEWCHSRDKKRWRVFLQYPVRLAYGLTVHKAQGLTVDRLHIGTGFFEAGHFYVALSRVRTLEGVTMNMFDPGWIRVDARVAEYYETELNDIYDDVTL